MSDTTELENKLDTLIKRSVELEVKFDLLMSTIAVLVGTYQKAIDRVADKKIEPEKPIESYINSLKFAKDRFATTPAQKRAIDSVISNAEKSVVNTFTKLQKSR